MPVLRCPFQAAERDVAEACVTQAVRQWRLRPPAIGLWLLSATAYIAPEDVAELVVEYDPALGLVSCEAWVAGRRVFGIDDLAFPA